MKNSNISHADYYCCDTESLASPWWNNLSTNFYKSKEGFSVNSDLRLRINSTASVDTIIRTGVASLAGLAGLPASLKFSEHKKERNRIKFYDDIIDEDRISEFYKTPPSKVKINEGPVTRYHFKPKDGTAKTLSFYSPFEAVNPELRERYAAHTRNQTAWAQYWKHDGPTRPTLIMIHGFVADPYWLNSLWLSLPWFYNQGYNVLLYTMPFHGRRKSQLSPFSGSQFFSQGLSMLNETFAHSIYDLRIFISYLREQFCPHIGVTGISLGGYTTSLISAIEDDLAFTIPNVPITTVIDLMKGWFPANHQVTLFEKMYDTDLPGLRKHTALHCPLTHSCKVPKESRLIIAGAGDRFSPPKHPALLRTHWESCEIHWFPGNHLIHLDQGAYLKKMRSFMNRALHDRGLSDEWKYM